jgi:oxygen-independent coproporphyrinogen-3 oxidase
LSEITELIEQQTPHPNSLYIHIPFCSSLCPYCDFYSIPYNEPLARRYLNSLIAELNLWTGHDIDLSSIKTVYIGGGTPGILPADSLTPLIDRLYEKINPEQIEEFTLEMNPENVHKHKMDQLTKVGITRISLGVQSFNPRNLSILERQTTPSSIKNALTTLSALDSITLSCDLIYGIKGNGTSDIVSDLTQLIEYDVRHISAYELTLKPENPLNEYKMDDEHTADEYISAVDYLKDKGYDHYEISNFSKPDYQSKHNLNYWKRCEYLGLGVSSASLLGDYRFSNLADITEYIRVVEKGDIPLLESELITGERMAREALMLGLRLTEGVVIDGFRTEYRYDLLNRMDNVIAPDGSLTLIPHTVPVGMQCMNAPPHMVVPTVSVCRLRGGGADDRGFGGPTQPASVRAFQAGTEEKWPRTASPRGSRPVHQFRSFSPLPTPPA